MKNKTMGKTMKVAAATGLLGVAVGALAAPPQFSAAQQNSEDKTARVALANLANQQSAYRQASFGGRDGRRDNGPEGRGSGGRPPGPPRGGQFEDGPARGPQLGDMIEQLDLSAAQQEKVKKMLDFEREKMDALHEQMLKIQSQTRANIEAVLTAEQKQQLTTMEAQEARRPGPDDGPRSGGPGGRRGPRDGGPRDGGPRDGGPRGER